MGLTKQSGRARFQTLSRLRLRPHLSYANVIATLALLLSLSGGAYAAAKVGAQDIKRNAVRSKHIAAGQVRAGEVRDGALRGRHLRANSVTGAQIDESTLGPVSEAQQADNAAALEGQTADEVRSGLVEGTGSVRSIYGEPVSLNPVFFEVDGIRLIATCGPSASGFEFGNLSGTTARLFNQTAGTVQDVGTGGSVSLASLADGQQAHRVLQVAWGPDFSRTTTFIASLHRPGCPARLSATAITADN